MKHNLPLREHRWSTLTSLEDPDGTELLLEPGAHQAVPPFKEALKADGVPSSSFQVTDLDAEYARLSAKGVTFTVAPMKAPPVKMAVLDDTCGNLTQLVEMLKEQPA